MQNEIQLDKPIFEYYESKADYKRARNQFCNIKYRAKKQGISFELGDFRTFTYWIYYIAGGYKKGYNLARIADQGGYDYINVRYVTKRANLQEKANYYLVTDLISNKQVVKQCALQALLKEEFGVDANTNVYSYVNSDNLYKSRYKIQKLTL